jgi:hypothetical protein
MLAFDIISDMIPLGSYRQILCKNKLRVNCSRINPPPKAISHRLISFVTYVKAVLQESYIKCQPHCLASKYQYPQLGQRSILPLHKIIPWIILFVTGYLK